MKNKWLIILLIFSVTINIAAIFTIGFHWWQTKRFRSPQTGGEIASVPPGLRLQLKPEQKEAMRNCNHRLNLKLQPYKQCVIEQRRKLFKLLTDATVDSLQMRKQLDSLFNLQKQVQTRIFYNMLEQREFLNEAQYQHLLRRFGNRFMNPYPEKRRGRHLRQGRRIQDKR